MTRCQGKPRINSGANKNCGGKSGSRRKSYVKPATPSRHVKSGIHNGVPVMKQLAAYTMASKPKGTLYTGVTCNLKGGCGNIGPGCLAIWISRLTDVGNGSLLGVGQALLCPTYEVDQSERRFCWIPAFAGMTKKYQSPRSHGFALFSQNAPRHSREGGNP